MIEKWKYKGSKDKYITNIKTVKYENYYINDVRHKILYKLDFICYYFTY